MAEAAERAGRSSASAQAASVAPGGQDVVDEEDPATAQVRSRRVVAVTANAPCDVGGAVAPVEVELGDRRPLSGQERRERAGRGGAPRTGR